jgi:hypothetical protein
VDSAIARAHQHVAGAPKSRSLKDGRNHRGGVAWSDATTLPSCP